MDGWTETWRGIVAPWECDITEHFTIAYYFDRLADAASITAASLARISQRGGCTGALDLRKSCWMNGLSQRQGEARCGQSVARICLDLHRLKGTRWWPLSMVAG